MQLSEGDHDRADRKFENLYDKFDHQTKTMNRQTMAFVGMAIAMLTLAGVIVSGGLT